MTALEIENLLNEKLGLYEIYELFYNDKTNKIHIELEFNFSELKENDLLVKYIFKRPHLQNKYIDLVNANSNLEEIGTIFCIFENSISVMDFSNNKRFLQENFVRTILFTFFKELKIV